MHSRAAAASRGAAQNHSAPPTMFDSECTNESTMYRANICEKSLPATDLGQSMNAPKKSKVLAGGQRWKRQASVELAIDARIVGKVVQHRFFRGGVYSAILVNAIQLGVAAPRPSKSADWEDVWMGCDHVFTAFFALEMILMIAARGREYFEDYWLLFDFAVAWLAILDSWIFPALDVGGDYGLLKMFRLLRLLRIAKLTKAVPELTVVVEGLLNSMKSMFWIGVLMLVMIYAFAICCVQVIGNSDSGYPSYSEGEEDIHTEIVDSFNNYIFFGTVLRSIHTLFGILLLSEWSLIRPVMELHYAFVPLFFVALVMVTFGVMNVIIGIVTTETTAAMDALQNEKRDALIQEQHDTAHDLADLLFDLDENADNKLSREELEKGLHDENFEALISKLQLPMEFSAAEFLSMLDADGNGNLSKTEFVTGVLRLIYCTDFHSNCMHASSTGMIHNALKKMRVDIKNEIAKAVQEICQEVKSSHAPAVNFKFSDLMTADAAPGQSAAMTEKVTLASPPMLPSPFTPVNAGAVSAPSQVLWEPLRPAFVQLRAEWNSDSTALASEAVSASIDASNLKAVWLPLSTAPIVNLAGPTSTDTSSNLFGSVLAGSCTDLSKQYQMGFLPVVNLWQSKASLDENNPLLEDPLLEHSVPGENKAAVMGATSPGRKQTSV